jgi:isoleucyl-tRNA synthetase
VVLDSPNDSRDAELQVTVERADGAKCERCWKYSTKVGEDAAFPTVCDSCSAALQEMAGSAVLKEMAKEPPSEEK